MPSGLSRTGTLAASCGSSGRVLPLPRAAQLDERGPHVAFRARGCIHAPERTISLRVASPADPLVIGVQVDVAAADDGGHVAAGEAVTVFQDGGDAEGR